MRVGVTGGVGFIGRYVVEELAARGHEPLIFDHLGRESGGVEVMLGDTRDAVAVTELAAHVDGIIHLASVLGTQETVFNPRPAVLTNVESGLNVFEAAAQYDLPCVNIAVGNAGMNNPYSASKTCVEALGLMFAADRKLRINQVRAVNAYGPRQAVAAPYGPAKVRKIMPSFICRALAGDPVEVYGDGRQVSDMVHVKDVATALVNALHAASYGTVFERVAEVGPAEHHTVLEVAEMVVAAVRDLGYPVAEIAHRPMRPGETPGAVVTADVSTLPMLGMDADRLVPLEKGVEETVAWFEAHWLGDYQWATTARAGR